MQSPSFVVELEKTLNQYPEVNSKSLQLELLESSALGDLKSINSLISACINVLGLRIALDDFGTGYSSLTHLRNLPVQTIKIDQSFVRDMLDDPNDYTIIDGIIGLADSFNREVIAEGVETTEHGIMLLIMGCHEAQGNVIARPMPPADFYDWLSNYTPNQEWIKCANKDRTQTENKKKLFKLTINQWQKHFENKIQSSSTNFEQWPIIKRTRCHCGTWIKRAKQDQFFEENWLKTLENAHKAMHDTADELLDQYKQGDVDKARANLIDIKRAVEHMRNVLEQCE